MIVKADKSECCLLFCNLRVVFCFVCEYALFVLISLTSFGPTPAGFAICFRYCASLIGLLDFMRVSFDSM